MLSGELGQYCEQDRLESFPFLISKGSGMGMGMDSSYKGEFCEKVVLVPDMK